MRLPHLVVLRLLLAFLLALMSTLLSLFILNTHRTVAGAPASNPRAGVWTSVPFTPTGHFEAVFSPGIFGSDYLPLAVSPSLDNGGAAFASLVAESDLNTIWRSLDGGQSWMALQMPRSAFQIHLALSPDFANDQTIFALLGDDLYKSTDRGDHWIPTGVLSTTQFGYNSLLVLSPDYTVDRAIFVGMYDWSEIGGVYSSTDDGRSWRLLTGDLACCVTDFDLSPGYPDDPTMFAVSYNDGIFRSDDGGTTWNHLGSPQYSPDFRVALSPNFPDDNTLFVGASGISNGGAFRSRNRGDTWTSIRTGRYTNVIVVSPGFGQDQTVVVGDGNGELHISEDAGDTWFPLQGFFSYGSYGHKNHVAIAYEDELLRLVASDYQTIYRYRWPSLGLAQIPVLIDPTSTDPMTVSVPLKPDDVAETGWEIDEDTSWLSIMPLTGTLPSTAILTVTPIELTGTTRTFLTITTQWSLRQTETITVSVLALFVYGRVWLPILTH